MVVEKGSESKMITEKTLTPAEKKKREEIAKAIERDQPGIDMSRKMAIATATAKRVAEDAPAGANVASIPNPATTAMGPKFKPMSVTDRRRKKDKTVLLKRFRTYMDDKNNG